MYSYHVGFPTQNLVLSTAAYANNHSSRNERNMKLRFSAIVLLVALYAHGGTSASLPSQLRRNVIEATHVADEAGQMTTPDSVELAMGDECMMMCEVSEGQSRVEGLNGAHSFH